MVEFVKRNVAYVAWITAIVATVWSLYFSEVAKIPACVLCWYQRIFLYPIVLILAVGIARRDKAVSSYVLPLSIIGLGIAFYHYLLQVGIIPEKLTPCVAGISCATKYVEWFGFITIPLLSVIAFGIITACMLWMQKENKKS